jgi:hypothetical protein
MPVIQAQDIVNAAIQDSMNQTTNRTALYDYTDRIHQRILRESQWRFLLSDPKYFVTMPGVSSYNLTSTAAPAGVFQTDLNLTNFANIAPGTMFNVSTWTKIEEDSDSTTASNYFLNRDGSLRYGYPRTYSNSLTVPGVINIKPVPDDQNFYYPVPETPVVTYAIGSTSLPNRIYYGVVTFVDSFGGEGTQCVIPFTIAVPAGNLLTVESPNPSIGIIGGNQINYSGWNLYIGYTQGSYNRQNQTPIPIGTNFTEGSLGINTGNLQVPSTSIALPPANANTVLSIDHSGILGTTNVGVPVIPAFWAIEDTSNQWWEVTTNPSTGRLETVAVPSNPATTNVFSAIYLTDVEDISTWKITVTTGGLLQATNVATPPLTSALNGQPPTQATIQPLNAYVIQFRYYQTRNQIANPTDVLQIPYTYKDIVVAGVNYMASLYRDRLEAREPSAQTIIWKRDFNEGLSQIRRDLRVSFRKTDFIAPDTASQYVVANQQGIPTMGW